MRKVIEYRKLLGVDKAVTLAELKSLYRNFMKEFHPDKIQDNEELKLEVEEKSKKIIEAYHFLVSIAPETALFELRIVKPRLPVVKLVCRVRLFESIEARMFPLESCHSVRLAV